MYIIYRGIPESLSIIDNIVRHVRGLIIFNIQYLDFVTVISENVLNNGEMFSRSSSITDESPL